MGLSKAAWRQPFGNSPSSIQVRHNSFSPSGEKEEGREKSGDGKGEKKREGRGNK